jgi:hypothetical protein
MRIIFNNLVKLLITVTLITTIVACDDDSSDNNENNVNNVNNINNTNNVNNTNNINNVIDDPLCPLSFSCTDLGEGYNSCLEDGEYPSGTNCHDSETGCDDNKACMYTDDEKTTSVCVENCGECTNPSTKCSDVTGDGYLGCLDGGYIPSGAPTACHDGDGCSGNATCFFTNSERTESVCIDNCSACREGTCSEDQICGDSGICIPKPCVIGECPLEEVCVDGTCIPDIGDGPGAGPGPECPDLPDFVCTGTNEYCGELIQFTPDNNPSSAEYDATLGYIEYPENGETWDNQYRSFLRRDVIMAMKYAAAITACKAVDWDFGNGMPIGTIDMSEADGAIPGTSIGSAGHPDGTHTDGFDIDMAYLQVNQEDNRARPICDHYENGSEAYHCTSAPHSLDPWRTAFYLGILFSHPAIRVIGVDGKVGQMVTSALNTLCEEGWLSGSSCSNIPLAYEVTDEGNGWYLFHHHHFHTSFNNTDYGSKISTITNKGMCLVPGCDKESLRLWYSSLGKTKPIKTKITK